LLERFNPCSYSSPGYDAGDVAAGLQRFDPIGSEPRRVRAVLLHDLERACPKLAIGD
jgi:hypothetical protein